MSEAVVNISNSTVTVNVFTKVLESLTEEDKKILGPEMYDEIVSQIKARVTRNSFPVTE